MSDLVSLNMVDPGLRAQFMAACYNLAESHIVSWLRQGILTSSRAH